MEKLWILECHSHGPNVFYATSPDDWTFLIAHALKFTSWMEAQKFKQDHASLKMYEVRAYEFYINERDEIDIAKDPEQQEFKI